MQRPRTVRFVTEITHLRVLDVVYPPGTDFDTHVHEEAYACLVVEGGYRDWAPHERRVTPGTTQCWQAGSRHAVRTESDPVRILHVADPEDGRGLATHPLRTGILWQLAAELSSFDIDDADDANRLGLECLVAELAEPPPRATSPEARPAVRGSRSWLDRVRARLREEFRDSASLDELAALADRHPSHVTRAFRQEWGVTPGEYLRRVRLAEAIRLLRETEMPLSSVAYAAGFADQSHLGRWMRRYVSATPGEVRAGTS